MEDKLETIDYNANNYVLPNDLSLSSVDVSANMTIDGSLSAIDASFQPFIKNIIVDGSSRELPYVTRDKNYAMVDNNGKWVYHHQHQVMYYYNDRNELGGVKKGKGVEIESDGTLSIDKTILYNIEQNTIKIEDVEIKPATEIELGGIKREQA